MKRLREIRYFFFSQHFSEGLRITLAVLLPSLLLSLYGHLETGLALSLGALCTSITDAPGPPVHRRQGMLYSLVVILATTIVTGFARMNIYVLGVELVAGAFLFSMFNVYGMRAAAIGSAGLLVMVLNMDKPLSSSGVLLNGLLVAAGGVWYMSISLLFFALRPYRLPQRLLGDSIREMAAYFSIKARFYDTHTDLDDGYRRLVAQQVTVHEKQEAVREILFKTKQIVREDTVRGQALVFLFVESVDLFDDITVTYYDYDTLRKRYGHTGLLPWISTLIQEMANELDRIGMAVQGNTLYQTKEDFAQKLATLRAEIDRVADADKEGSTFVLKKIVVNLRNLLKRIGHFHNYVARKENNLRPPHANPEHHRFVAHQSFSAQELIQNLSFDSAVFRYALRTAFVCALGFVLAKTLSFGQHSYWILLTIVFIMKPAYSLTKQRNIERVIGTLGGGVIGLLILLFVHNSVVLLSLLVLFMLGSYSFLRANYLVMVFCVTPMVLILFHFLGLGYISIVQERIVDTVIGCLIAFTASYLVLPKWEGQQLAKVFKEMLLANMRYLRIVARNLREENVPTIEYKLARKDVYVHSANLSAAVQRMLSEPKSKQKSMEAVHRFAILNHVLFSNIAAVAFSVSNRKEGVYPPELSLQVQRSRKLLHAAVSLLQKDHRAEEDTAEEVGGNTAWTAEDRLLHEQLGFIQKISTDIVGVTRHVRL